MDARVGEELQAMLEEVRRAEHEYAVCDSRLAVIARDVGAAEADERAADAALAREARDVERLERFSMARIVAAVRGSRDADLDRERVEAQRAELTLAAARHRTSQLRARVAELERQREAARSVVAQRPEVESRREQWLRGASPEAAQALDDVAGRLAAADAELRELDEALAAGEAAASALSVAAARLGSARTWSAYDTFLGGGMIASSIKHERIDQATAALRRADDALQRLGLELRDVGITDVLGLDIPGLRRTFDIWFDNIFSDLGVRDAILRAADQVDRMRERLVRVVLDLRERRAVALVRRAQVEGERSRLLERCA